MAIYEGTLEGVNSYKDTRSGMPLGPGKAPPTGVGDGAADDELYGYGGDDTLQGYGGANSIEGGEGNRLSLRILQHKLCNPPGTG